MTATHDPLRHDRCPAIWTLQEVHTGEYRRAYRCGHVSIVAGGYPAAGAVALADADHDRHCTLMVPLLEDWEVGR